MSFSQTKHPTALSPALPVPAPGPWFCSSAAPFSPSPFLGGLDSGSGAALPDFEDRFGPAAVCCRGRQHGSVAWQVPGRLVSPCSALRLPKARSPASESPVRSCRTKYGRGGENVQGNVLSCVEFHRSRSFSPAGERVYDSNMLSYLHPLWFS